MTLLDSLLLSVVDHVYPFVDQTPAPTPGVGPTGDVGPGPLGFALTAMFIMLAGFLIFDMIRRVTRVSARQEARNRIMAEQQQSRAEHPKLTDPNQRP